MSVDDTKTGLYKKYTVERIDENGVPKESHKGRRYFVLDVDNDIHAAKALWAYAESCQTEYPTLAVDLMLWSLESRVSESSQLSQELQQIQEDYANGTRTK